MSSRNAGVLCVAKRVQPHHWVWEAPNGAPPPCGVTGERQVEKPPLAWNVVVLPVVVVVVLEKKQHVVAWTVVVVIRQEAAFGVGRENA